MGVAFVAGHIRAVPAGCLAAARHACIVAGAFLLFRYFRSAPPRPASTRSDISSCQLKPFETHANGPPTLRLRRGPPLRFAKAGAWRGVPRGDAPRSEAAAALGARRERAQRCEPRERSAPAKRRARARVGEVRGGEAPRGGK